MPFKSKSQMRYFHFLQSEGKLPKSVNLDEWDAATKGEKLPQHLAHGGYVGKGYDEDDDAAWFDPEDTSGSPEEHSFEEDKPKIFVKYLMSRRK